MIAFGEGVGLVARGGRMLIQLGLMQIKAVAGLNNLGKNQGTKAGKVKKKVARKSPSSDDEGPASPNKSKIMHPSS